MNENLNSADNILTPGPSPTERGEEEAQIKADAGYLTGDSEIVTQLVQHAKLNRKAPTDAERLLWINLRNRKLGDKFRRQHPVGKYIPDFVCLEKRLIIEVDGDYHTTGQQNELDEERTFELEQKYLFKVLRFSNEEVLTDIVNVLNKIREFLSQY